LARPNVRELTMCRIVSIYIRVAQRSHVFREFRQALKIKLADHVTLDPNEFVVVD
jgi:hypothetical protein